MDAVEVKDFRPISLIHGFAKLVAKLMANRLALLLPSLISTSQGAFVRGRNIHDNFILVQHTVKSLHKKKEAHVLLKLDISKAFDSVSWLSLLEIMRKIGFGQRWLDLICLICLLLQPKFWLMGNQEILYSITVASDKEILSPLCFLSL
jgi:hypothetical protein